jgi:archaellum component FlaC
MNENKVVVTNELFEQFEGIINGLTSVKNQINTLQQSLKQLEKNVKKGMKGLKKDIVKNKVKGNRKPSGFARPSKVSKELCEFMKKNEEEAETRMMTKNLGQHYAYIKHLKNLLKMKGVQARMPFDFIIY